MTKQKFAVFDVDGTLIRWQLYHAIVDELIKTGVLETDSHHDLKHKRLEWKKRSGNGSYKDYEHTVAHTFIDNASSVSASDLRKAVNTVFDIYKDQTYRYTRNLVNELKNDGYFLLMISGSHHEIITKLGKYYGFNDYIGNQYHSVNGKLTGESRGTIDKKDVLLQEFVKKHNLTYKSSIGVGDSESDIPMLKLVEKPVAFNPTQGLYDVALENNWEIVVERKDVIYTLSDYPSKTQS